MFKKVISLVMCTALAAGLVSCSADSRNTDSDKISVVTTIFPQYDFVRQIAGENVQLTMLLKPGSESHTYEPTPQDIVKINECDLFIYNGGEGDAWVDSILESADNSVNTLAMMDCVETVEEEIVEGMEAEEEESGEPELDEHVWTSPENAVKIVECIADRLCEADAENAGKYRENTKKYVEELNNLDSRFKEIVSESSTNTMLFGDRFPFRYFADTYKINYYAAFPGCSSESEPSASTIAFLIDKVNDEKIPAVFTIEFSNKKIAETISESTGAEILEFHSCHNITSEDMKNGETYISIMNRNADNLQKAFQLTK
ncbi:MAG: metal ABC transporter substrate-binding protein [Oscillospiraceae bacterium]|nr:metal ABC transporter substrate-binding protein [Oscillospiraceae bacterium]